MLTQVLLVKSSLRLAAGQNLPQYGVLYTSSTQGGYLRLVYGPTGGWGTSIILSPSFWTSDGVYHQGTALNNVHTQINCSTIQLSFDETLAGLSFSGILNIDPPANNQVTAHVSMTTSNTVTLATNRPGEAFKPVALSTMFDSTTVWDSQSAIIGSTTSPLVATSGWIVPSPIAATHFGLVGGPSLHGLNANTPTITIDLAGVSSPVVTGWIAPTQIPMTTTVRSGPPQRKSR